MKGTVQLNRHDAYTVQAHRALPNLCSIGRMAANHVREFCCSFAKRKNRTKEDSNSAQKKLHITK